MSDQQDLWSVRATISRPHVRDGAPYYLARRASDGAYAILQKLGTDYHLHGPVVDVEIALRTAEHVAAGNPSALTWPSAMRTLATAVLAMADARRMTDPPAPVPPAPVPDGGAPAGAAAVGPQGGLVRSGGAGEDERGPQGGYGRSGGAGEDETRLATAA